MINQIGRYFFVITTTLLFVSCGGGGGGSPSTNANLEAISISAGTLIPDFDSGTSSYTIEVGLSVASVTITASTAHSGATLKVDGSSAPSGIATAPILLAVGNNPIDVVVTAEDGSTTKTYSLIFNRATDYGTSDNLSDLTLSSGVLSPAFLSAQTSYTATVGFLATSLNITATSQDAFAFVSIKGQAVNYGNASQIISLDEGDNILTVVVAPEDITFPTKTYTVTVTRETAADFAQQAYVKASNTDTGDQFGVSVALDGNTMAVGATGADSGAVNSGAVYIFTRNGSTWSPQAYIKASNAGYDDLFGASVSIAGDTLVVGASGEASNGTSPSDNNALGAGAVYVFGRSGSTWSQQAYIKASNTNAGDQFGVSVAVDGDTLVVGANREDSAARGINSYYQSNNNAANAGAVYVFNRSGGIWAQKAYIKASNTNAGDQFGVSIAVDGDTLVVGANREDSTATGINSYYQSNNNAENAGAVYVFERRGGIWSQQSYIKASNTRTSDEFGISVAVDGDTLAVGAHLENNAGAVYVFSRSGSIWSQQANIKASNTEAGDGFGVSVAVDADTLLVGASGEDSAVTSINGIQSNNNATNAGAVYVFNRSGISWSQQFYIKASNTEGSDEYGISVALDGDTLIVGAIGEASNGTGQTNNNAPDAGAVYVLQ